VKAGKVITNERKKKGELGGNVKTTISKGGLIHISTISHILVRQ
jgi:predicted RNA-binding protein with RPS1 domain